MSDFPVVDDDYNAYPSAEGAMVQAVKMLIDPLFDPWYSFERVESPEDGVIYINVISYNENSEEDKVYILKMSLEADNDDLS